MGKMLKNLSLEVGAIIYSTYNLVVKNIFKTNWKDTPQMLEKPGFISIIAEINGHRGNGRLKWKIDRIHFE